MYRRDNLRKNTDAYGESLNLIEPPKVDKVGKGVGIEILVVLHRFFVDCLSVAGCAVRYGSFEK